MKKEMAVGFVLLAGLVSTCLALGKSGFVVVVLIVVLLMWFLFFSWPVQSPPQIVKQPPSDELLFQVVQRIDENDKPFVIECEAEGEPAPK